MPLPVIQSPIRKPIRTVLLQKKSNSYKQYGNIIKLPYSTPDNGIITKGNASVELQGVTLKNELNYTPSTWSEWAKTAGVVGDVTGLEFTSDGTTNVTATCSTSLKPSTKYGVLFYVASSNILNSIRIPGTQAFSNGINFTSTVGYKKGTDVTLATISANLVSLRFQLAETNGLKFKIKDIRIFELPAGSQIEADFTNRTADELALMYPYVQGGTVMSSNFSTDVQSIVQNGNFTNSTTGWGGNDATITVDNQTLNVIGKGTSATVQAVSTSIPYTNGKQIFVRYTFKVTNENCTAVRINISATGMSTQSAILMSNPVINTTYTKSVIITLASGGSGNITIRPTHTYVDAPSSLDKVMEVKEVTAIDIGTSSANPLYNKSLTDMQKLFPDFVPYGTIKVGLGSVKAIGRNLFDGKTSQGTWGDTITAHAQRLTTTNKIPINYSDVITLSGITLNALNGWSYYIQCYDASKNYIGGTAWSTAYSWTNNIFANCRYMAINFYKTVDGVYQNIIPSDFPQQVQINKGTTALPYEPYTETQATIPPIELRQVGSVADTFSVDGVHTQRIGKIIIQASDVANIHTSAANVDYALLTKPIDALCYGNLTVLNSVFLDNYKDFGTGGIIDINNISAFSTTKNLVSIFVGFTKGTTLAQAQTALTGKVLLYQLKNPIETKYVPSVQMNCPDGLIVDNGYTLQIAPSGDVNNSTVPVSNVQYQIV